MRGVGLGGRVRSHRGGCVVAPCLVVIDGTLHSQMPSDTGAVQRVHRAWPSQSIQRNQGRCMVLEGTGMES
jgi:hypothetical protein